MKHDPNESAIKLVLDHAELIERVPELQREATAVNYNDSGGFVLVPPRHPAVIAFIKELAGMEYGTVTDLKTARRRLRAASHDYQLRVTYRLMGKGAGQSPRFERFVSLSAILIARAKAMHWRKVVLGLEQTERTTKHNHAAREKGKRIRVGLAIGAAIKKAVTP